VQRALRDGAIGLKLRSLLGTPLAPAEVDRARSLVMRSAGIAGAVEVARRYAGEAARAAEELGDGLIPKSLAALSGSVLEDLESVVRRVDA
jgi:hypothetical protein